MSNLTAGGSIFVGGAAEAYQHQYRLRQAQDAMALEAPSDLLLPRAGMVADLKARLLAEGEGAALRIGLHGMGGSGKSVMLRLLAADPEIRARFPLRLIVTFAPDSDPLSKQRELAAALGLEAERLDDLAAARRAIKARLESERALILLDNLWTEDQARAFHLLGGGASRMAAASRDLEALRRLGLLGEASVFTLGPLSEAESLDLLALRAGEPPPPEIGAALARACGHLPLALTMAAALAPRPYSWRMLLERLSPILAGEAAARHDDYAYASLAASLEVSLADLEPKARTALRLCAALPPGTPLSEWGLSWLWRDCVEDEAGFLRLLALLEDRSLLSRLPLGPEAPGYLRRQANRRLHDAHHHWLRLELEREPEDDARRRKISLAARMAGEAASERSDRAAALTLHQESLRLDRLLAARPEAGPEDFASLAQALELLAALAEGVDDLEEARRLGEESLALRRERLALEGTPQARSALAGGLQALGVLAGRREEAAEARALLEESLALRRALAAEGAPEAPRALASALYRLGHALHKAGDLEEGRRLYEEALAILRALLADLDGDGRAEGSPAAVQDRARRRDALESELASNLVSLGVLLREIGELDEAQKRFEENLVLARGLAERVASAQARGGLADVLLSLGELAEERGDFLRARALHEESVAIRREAAESLATPQATRDLSSVLRHAGDLLVRMGEDTAQGQALLDESLSLARDLAARIDAPENREALIAVLISSADAAQWRGAFEAAAGFCEEALTLARAQPGEGPREARQRYLLLSRVALNLEARGDFDGARSLLLDCLEITRALTKDGSFSLNQRSLLFTLNLLSDAEKLRGDHQAARAFAEEALPLARLRAARFATPFSTHDLCTSLMKLGALASDQGDLKAGSAFYEEALATARAWAGTSIRETSLLILCLNALAYQAFLCENPDYEQTLLEEALDLARGLVARRRSPQTLSELMNVLRLLGQLCERCREWDEAQAFHEEHLGLAREHAADYPTTRAQEAIHEALLHLGDLMLKGRGDHEKARPLFQESADLAGRLAEGSGRPGVLSGLTVALMRLGTIAESRGDLDEARRLYERCRTIREKLAENPGTMNHRRNFSVTLKALSRIATERRDLPGARRLLERSAEIDRALHQLLETQMSLDDLVHSLARLGGLCAALGDLAGGYARHLEAVEAARRPRASPRPAPERFTTLADALLGFSRFCLSQGRTREAREAFEEARTLIPMLPSADRSRISDSLLLLHPAVFA